MKRKESKERRSTRGTKKQFVLPLFHTTPAAIPYYPSRYSKLPQPRKRCKPSQHTMRSNERECCPGLCNHAIVYSRQRDLSLFSVFRGARAHDAALSGGLRALRCAALSTLRFTAAFRLLLCLCPATINQLLLFFCRKKKKKKLQLRPWYTPPSPAPSLPLPQHTPPPPHHLSVSSFPLFL